MTIAEFKTELRECRTELEVRRLVQWHLPELVGTVGEIANCLNAADRVAETFALAEEGSVGEVCVDLAQCT